jgi:hypothetical protein
MSSLNRIGSEGYKDYPQLPEEENLTEEGLPNEIFNEIFSYLNDMEMQQASLVSRSWSRLAIDTAKSEKFSKIQKFAHFLYANLTEESYPSQKEKVASISSEKKIFDSANLIEVKSSIHFYENFFLNILKSLTEDDLKKFRKFV